MHDPADRSGSVLGDYTLRRLLGRGAMGEVYEALDTRRGRTVALKLLSPQFAGDAVFRERFLRESRMAAQLNDPHVIPIHDWGEIDGFLFLDMRIVSGGNDLRHLLSSGPLTPDRAVSIVEQVAQALDAAHAAGLVHRDVKPDNILIDSGDFAYLVDFGLAQTTTDPRLTDTGAAVGSFAYMAPERFGAGNIATPATDIYALTCVLVESLTGAAPFGAGDLQVLVAAHLNQAPPVLGSPFDAIVARGMAKNPAHRFGTAGELAQAANDALEGRVPPGTALPPSGPLQPAATGPGPMGQPMAPNAPIVHSTPPAPGAPIAPGAPMSQNAQMTQATQPLPPITYIPPLAGPVPGSPHTGYQPGRQHVPQSANRNTDARVVVVVAAVVFLFIIVIAVALVVALA
ncbi:protein kinase domain-containing protein [Gordonia sp. DT30]|uniref:serine/threonine-protein kinase n=1 Tax=unclassified Gordonia (in: high G+C Gram-positive bacteria) TaxID=2657482 RepID=UPI003CF91FBE